MRPGRDHLRAARALLAAPPTAVRAAVTVRRDHLSYLGPRALLELAAAVADTDRRAVQGSIIEAGTALGGSAIVMATAKGRYRPMHLYDTFGMIPPPSQADGADVTDRYQSIVKGQSEGIRGDTYYGYHDDLLGEVRSSFDRYGLDPVRNTIELHQGLFEDTLIVDAPVALAHLDGDWYESTKVCLDRITPHLSPGGRLVIDDYATWSGCRTATDEFLASTAGRSFRTEQKARLHILRR